MFQIDFKVSVHACNSEPEQFIAHYAGEVLVYSAQDDDLHSAAKVGLFVVHAEAAERAGVPLFDVLDLDAKTAPYLALLHGEEVGNFSPPVMRILNEDMATTRDMIILDRLEILPRFRGKGLGLKVMQACIGQFSGRSRIAAIKPFPLQFEPSAKQPSADAWTRQMELRAMSRRKRESKARLKDYYSRLGFVSVRGTDLMIRDLYRD